MVRGEMYYKVSENEAKVIMSIMIGLYFCVFCTVSVKMYYTRRMEASPTIYRQRFFYAAVGVITVYYR